MVKDVSDVKRAFTIFIKIEKNAQVTTNGGDSPEEQEKEERRRTAQRILHKQGWVSKSFYFKPSYKYCGNEALIAFYTNAKCYTTALQTADWRLHVRNQQIIHCQCSFPQHCA